MAWPRESRLTTSSTTSTDTSIAYDLRHLFEVGMLLADAVISKVLFLDHLITDDQFFGVALVKAHSTFSGKPLGGTNSPP